MLDDAYGPGRVYMPSLCQDISKNARQWPQTLAVTDSTNQWTWKEFESVMGAIARQLQAQGVGNSSVVSVYMPNSASYVAAVYAIWAVGAAFCPINYRLSTSEAERMLADASASLVIVSSDDDRQFGKDITAIDIHKATRFPDNGGLDFSPVTGHSPAWLFFTSGTSGNPKPAVITHTQIDAVVSNGVIDLMRGLDGTDTALAVAPLSHGALTHVLRQVRLGGHTVVYDKPRFEESKVLRIIVQERVKSTFMVPTMVRRLCEAAGTEEYRGTLTHLLSGGEPISRDLVRQVEKVFGSVLTNYYGLAEVTGAISQALPESVHSDFEGPVPAGQPRIGTSLELRRADGTSCSPGEHGEIWVSGANMFAGYLIRGVLDRSEFIDGWFKTKDIGYVNDGLLYIDGRSSDMFISGGSNVYPAEIERIINADHEVKQSAVVGVPDEKWGEVGVAFVVPSLVEIDEAKLSERVKRELAGYKVPRSFVIVNQLPHTPMDKVDKKRLKASYLESGTLSEVDHGK